jgi:thioredoxin-related protein
VRRCFTLPKKDTTIEKKFAKYLLHFSLVQINQNDNNNADYYLIKDDNKIVLSKELSLLNRNIRNDI